MSSILEEIETEIAGLKTSTTKSNVGVVREAGDVEPHGVRAAGARQAEQRAQERDRLGLQTGPVAAGARTGRPLPAHAQVVADRVRRALDDVDVDRLVLSSDCGLKYLPRASAEGKMRALAQAAAMLRSEL